MCTRASPPSSSDWPSPMRSETCWLRFLGTTPASSSVDQPRRVVNGVATAEHRRLDETKRRAGQVRRGQRRGLLPLALAAAHLAHALAHHPLGAGRVLVQPRQKLWHAFARPRRHQVEKVEGWQRGPRALGTDPALNGDGLDALGYQVQFVGDQHQRIALTDDGAQLGHQRSVEVEQRAQQCAEVGRAELRVARGLGTVGRPAATHPQRVGWQTVLIPEGVAALASHGASTLGLADQRLINVVDDDDIVSGKTRLEDGRRHISRRQLICRLKSHTAARAKAAGHLENSPQRIALEWPPTSGRLELEATQPNTHGLTCCSLGLVRNRIIIFAPHSEARRRLPNCPLAGTPCWGLFVQIGHRARAARMWRFGGDKAAHAHTVREAEPAESRHGEARRRRLADVLVASQSATENLSYPPSP
eukprot:scaffold3808_cov112-Isochrysis_galbana.AAC.29